MVNLADHTLVSRQNNDLVLADIPKVEAVFAHPEFAHVDAAAVDQILDAADYLAAYEFLSRAATSDDEEPVGRDGILQ